MNELRLLACAVLLNLGVGAVLGVGIARHMVDAIPRIASVRLTELVAEHAARAARDEAGDTGAMTRAWAHALERALDEVATRHRAVLLPLQVVAAGAPDLTAEVRTEMARSLTAPNPAAGVEVTRLHAGPETEIQP